MDASPGGTNSKVEMAQAHKERSARFSENISQTEGVTLVRKESDESEEITQPRIDPANLRGLNIEDTFKFATASLVGLQVAIIILFGLCSKIAYVEDFTKLYQMFTGIEIMVKLQFNV
jgi:hypothetical protein